MRDAVDLLRKNAATQPRRASPSTATTEELKQPVSPPPLPERGPLTAPAPTSERRTITEPTPKPEPEPEPEPEAEQPQSFGEVTIDDRNPNNDAATVFGEADRPIYQATRSVAVMSSYAPGGTELRKCNIGDRVQLSEVRTGKNGATRGRIPGARAGWVTIQLPNGTALFTPTPRAEESQPQPQSEPSAAAARNSGSSTTRVEPEVVDAGNASVEPAAVSVAASSAPAAAAFVPGRLTSSQESQAQPSRIVSPPELAPSTGAPQRSRAEKIAELRKNLVRVREDASPVRSRKQGPGTDYAAGAGDSGGGSNSGVIRQQKLRDVIDKQGIYIGSPRAQLSVQPEPEEQDADGESDTIKSKRTSSLLSTGSVERRKRMISFAPAAGGGTPGRDAAPAPTLSVASDISEQIVEYGHDDDDSDASDDDEKEDDDDAPKGAEGDGSEGDARTELTSAQQAAIAAFMVRSHNINLQAQSGISGDSIWHVRCAGNQAQALGVYHFAETEF